VQVRVEQRLRAEALATRGLAHLLLPDELSPQRLFDAIDQALAAPPPAVDLPLDGLRQASQAIRAMLEEPRFRAGWIPACAGMTSGRADGFPLARE
jgi:predicted glycosyltransferase